MNKIINLEQMSDFEVYNPILTLNEDVDFDNRFVIICTNLGNIAFSYYDLELLWEMEKKYPGLLEILKDPFGSLYLNDGMYLVAIQFWRVIWGKMKERRFNSCIRMRIWRCI